MTNNSSNGNMEQIFQKLAEIKKVEPETDLYFLTNNKIQNREKVSPTWLKAAAAILILLFASELMLFKSNNNNSTTAEMKDFLPQTNNLLYNEQD